jgi:4a-hydroxytetrahydrobiopterin dehydratase
MDVYNEVTAQPILKDLNDWKFNDNGIEKKFVFKISVRHFYSTSGILAEKQGHHPELLMFTIKSTFD